VNVGAPVIEGAQVKATVMDHMKGDKVFVFKKKNRKGYQKLNGHRQYLSLIRIEDILEKSASKPRAKKAKAEVQPEEPVVAESTDTVAEN
jgi:large subunit ribosomal protein L21